MISEALTASEIAAHSLDAVRVFEHYGIDYWSAGGRSLGEICCEKGLDSRVVLGGIRHAYTPPDRDWSGAPLRELMAFLVEVDHSYFREEIPVLLKRMETVLDVYGRSHPTLCKMPGVFRVLAAELEAHMRGEERDLFPAIVRHLQAIEIGHPLKGSPLAAYGGPLPLMELEHESVGAALRLMREFAQNYTVPAGACRRYRALTEGLAALEDRLVGHIYLENTVLYPRAAALKPGAAPARDEGGASVTTVTALSDSIP